VEWTGDVLQLTYQSDTTAANMVVVYVQDIAPGVCQWSFVRGQGSPVGHANQVRVIRDGSGFMPTQGTACRLVITDGYSGTVGDTLAGHTNTCTVESESEAGTTLEVNLRFAGDIVTGGADAGQRPGAGHALDAGNRADASPAPDAARPDAAGAPDASPCQGLAQAPSTTLSLTGENQLAITMGASAQEIWNLSSVTHHARQPAFRLR